MRTIALLAALLTLAAPVFGVENSGCQAEEDSYRAAQSAFLAAAVKTLPGDPALKLVGELWLDTALALDHCQDEVKAVRLRDWPSGKESNASSK